MKARNLGNRFCFAVIVVLLCNFSATASDVRSAVSAGQKAPSFRARALDGQIINFPSDYKGKVVLLDFWATWCGPCRAELPNVISTYQHLHKYGFDVVSVSLDEPRTGPALLQFIHANHMTWPQIYDGFYWKTPVAREYGIKAIPCPILVDGDTGKIIAQGPGALGDRLSELVETNLEAKGRKLPHSAPYNPHAPGKLTVTINGKTINVWRTGQLRSAEKQALTEHKPIAWIASDHRFFDGLGEISESGSRSATLHELYALRDKAVLVFENGPTENDHVLPLVNNAIHTPDRPWLMPFLLFLNSDATKVLAEVRYQPDFVKRARLLANALGEVGVKMSAAASQVNKQQ